jgi:asparagine synthase (glutamine-hydrolysing)
VGFSYPEKHLSLVRGVSYSIPPKTFFENIFKVPASHCLILDIIKLTWYLHKYWEFPYKVEEAFHDKCPSKILKDIEKLLINAVERRLLEDVEIGSFLSGGLDSSLITALYRLISGKKFLTFSIGYKEHKIYDELNYANKVASFLKTEHYPILVGKEDFLEIIDETIKHTGEPIADPANLPTYLLAKKTNEKNIKVILVGEGSDELFMGYPSYFTYLDFYKLQNSLEENLRKKLGQYHKRQRNLTKEWEYFKRAFNGEIIFRTTQETFTDYQKQLLFKENFFKNLPNSEDILHYYFPNLSKIKDTILLMSYIDINLRIPELLMAKVDRMTMAFSIEARAPFLDYKLVEYIAKIPQSLKIQKGPKSLLKPIALKYLPQEIVLRPKKGFSSPHFEWYISTYGASELSKWKKVNSILNWFNNNFLEFLYNEALHNKFKMHFWTMVIFVRWFNIFYK